MQGRLEYDVQAGAGGMVLDNDDAQLKSGKTKASVLTPPSLKALLLDRKDYDKLPRIKEKDDEEVIWKPREPLL